MNVRTAKIPFLGKRVTKISYTCITAFSREKILIRNLAEVGIVRSWAWGRFRLETDARSGGAFGAYVYTALNILSFPASYVRAMLMSTGKLPGFYGLNSGEIGQLNEKKISQREILEIIQYRLPMSNLDASTFRQINCLEAELKDGVSEVIITLEPPSTVVVLTHQGEHFVEEIFQYTSCGGKFQIRRKYVATGEAYCYDQQRTESNCRWRNLSEESPVYKLLRAAPLAIPETRLTRASVVRSGRCSSN